MAKINSNYRKLQAGYLFPEISRRVREFEARNPKTQLIKLGIGDTTLPLPVSVIKTLHKTVDNMADESTYSGYGAEQGSKELRLAIVNHYKRYGVKLDENEVFVSDGAKPDSANIQSIFNDKSVIAVQDPVYPVYVDSAVIGGKTGEFVDGRYQRIVYMDCNESNGFFPEPPKEKVDLIYLCSPNNPTGTVATHSQLKSFVDYARKNDAVIIFDSAYSAYISNNKLPKSIYEIEEAENCAIEINSFSKMAGFTGVRLGWSIVPHKLRVENTQPGEVQALWNRRQTTMFNGASNIVQPAGVKLLSKEGQKEVGKMVEYYMKNAKVILEGLNQAGIKTYGGENAPYIWAKTPKGLDSWEFFDVMLDRANVVITPGAGFGRMGEGFFRVSAFGKHSDIKKAINSIKENL